MKTILSSRRHHYVAIVSIFLIMLIMVAIIAGMVCCGGGGGGGGQSYYTITIASTAGGSVATPGVGTFTCNAGTVGPLVAIPDPGYWFVNWIGNVGTIANVTAASTTITMNGNYSITANFARQPAPIIVNGDVSKKIDVVFVGSGFSNIASFNQTIWQLIDYNGTSNGLMSIEPFRSNRTRFNFWMVDTLQTFTNTNFRNESDNLVNSIAPFADEKVVLFVTPRIWDNADGWGYWSWNAITTQWEWIWTDSGGFGSYVTVGNQFLTDSGWPLYADYNPLGNLYPTPQILCYSRNQVRWAFVHEFGHSFGGLWDEYNLGSGTAAANFIGPPTYTPNADRSPCNKWSYITSVCYLPCGYTDWCRSTSDSIMRSIPGYPPALFNTVSQNELIKDIGSGSLTSYASYVLPLTYTSGTFIPGNLTVVAAPPPGGSSSQPSTGYTVQISSASGTILYSTEVGVTAVVGAPSPDWFDEDGNQIYFPHEMLHILDPFETKLILPSFSDAKKISMYDPEGMLVFDVHI